MKDKELTKHCSGCDTTKPITAFYKRAAAKDKLDNFCKDCRKSLNKKNPPKYDRAYMKAYMAKWKEKNPDYMKGWYDRNPDYASNYYQKYQKPKDQAKRKNKKQM
jgi:hypothetical protein